MKREIKFRAWDSLQGGKFEYWDFKTNKYDGIFWEMIKNKSFKEPNEFTGRKDKNGKEIYEGDILRTVNYFDADNKPVYLYHKVVYDTERAVFNAINLSNENDLLTTNGNCFLYVALKTPLIEVIGNIYANTELIASETIAKTNRLS